MTGAFFLRPNIGPVPDQPQSAHFRDRASFERFATAYADAFADLPTPDDTRAVETYAGPVRAYHFARHNAVLDGTGSAPRVPGAPLVLLSGRQASTPVWRANIESLRTHHDVWSLDSIGEPGASTQTAPVRDAADQARWVDEALAGLPLERAHLMGVSIGGWLAMQTAIHRPDRLASVTLLDPAATFAPLTWKMIVVSLGSVIPAMPQALRHRLLGWISGGSRSDDTVPEGRLISSAMRDFVQHQPAPNRPSTAQLTAIATPMLVILAGNSIVHDAQRAARAASTVPGAQVEVWAGASHAINGERPDDITARVHTFVHSLEPQ